MRKTISIDENIHRSGIYEILNNPEYNLITSVVDGMSSVRFDLKDIRRDPEFYEEDDKHIRRPIWHKWVYGAGKK